MATTTPEKKSFAIGSGGFEVVGCDESGWIVMRSRRPFGEDIDGRERYYATPFVAAFSTFAELLKWLGKRELVNGRGEVAT